MTSVAALAGLLLVGGLWLLVGGLQRRAPVSRRGSSASPAQVWARWSRRPAGPRGRRRDVVLVLGLAAGTAVAAATGWLIALPLVPVLALGLPYLLTAPRARDIALLEALDRWVRSLSATLATGKSITDALRISRRTAPPLLADEVETLVARLNNRWDTREALLRMADALDSPDADGVLAPLILAANRGANGASVTLQALADSLQATLAGRRAIEVERSKPYVVVRQVTVISLGTLLVAFAVSPDFFVAYRSGIGQLVLGVLLLAYLGSLLLMRRKAQQRERPRILVGAPR
ncbi:type II secretion system F family protein [Microlunatus capsulatus]|uniref:Flp pilus assembly protein TadB n=1 Tax=Microlunatus capsulatus TaxID=99117 RepID=A0ABS4Z929_9ACTN|nr:type II secretion system F family protein [Microlunatus capsulatus]MBP2417245.1 Flp pilus assembly protein TadB [Microlunatus capsulatus]